MIAWHLFEEGRCLDPRYSTPDGRCRCNRQDAVEIQSLRRLAEAVGSRQIRGEEVTTEIKPEVHCTWRACHDIAMEFTVESSTGRVTWATCAKHKRWARPYVEIDGRKLTANASTVRVIIKSRIQFRLELAGKKLPDLVIDEMADDIMDGVFTGATRTVAKYLIKEREENKG